MSLRRHTFYFVFGWLCIAVISMTAVWSVT